MSNRKAISTKKKQKKPRRLSLHAGHRSRLRKRAAENGLDSFEPHEAVELLLFESLPRVNTNETAHRLLRASGSLKALLREGPEKLMQQRGVGKASARLITSVLPRVSAAVTEALSREEPFSRWTLLAAADFRLNFFMEPGAVLLLSAGRRMLEWRAVSRPELLVPAAEDALRRIREADSRPPAAEAEAEDESAEEERPRAFLVLVRRDAADALLSGIPAFPADRCVGSDGERIPDGSEYRQALRALFPEAAGIFILHPERKMEEL